VLIKAPLHDDVLGSGGIAPRILDSTRWRWVVRFIPRRKIPRYPLHRRPAGLQSRSGRGG